MTTQTGPTQPNRTASRIEVLLSLGLFLLALVPRLYDLDRFVTADEAKWVYRSAQFLAALLSGDFAATSVNLTPAVTTTWLGSAGLSVYYYLNQAAIQQPFLDWLRSLPEFRTEVPILVAARWPMALLTALAIPLFYGIARRLFSRSVAFMGAVFIGLDPHLVSLSRVLGHDAPIAIFMPLSVLVLLLALRRKAPAWGLLAGSGLLAGLAILSKAPALFLIPFTALLLLILFWQSRLNWTAALKIFLLWSLTAYLAFLVLWPAAWVEPVGRPLAVVENAVLSATDDEEADSENYWLVPNLGPFYYLVNGAFKLSPLVMVGAGLIAAFALHHRYRSAPNPPTPQPPNPQPPNLPTSQPPNPPTPQPPNLPTPQPPNLPTSQPPNLPTPQPSNLPTSPTPPTLFLFILLFTIFMTFSDKRSARYILPAFPPLALLAALGWRQLYRFANPRPSTSRLARLALPAILTVSAVAILWPYAPYYFSYFNPLVGGPYTAPNWVKIGWGEGLDRVGRFLQREIGPARVGVAYDSPVAAFYQGDLSRVTGDRLDYVILYSKQVQSGEPHPAFIRYFEQVGPIFSVDLNGLHYADVYPGPAVRPALAKPAGRDGSFPLGFRASRPYGAIGQPLAVDLLWSPAAPPTGPVRLKLVPASALERPSDGGQTLDDAGPAPILAQAEGQTTRVGPDLVVSRHHLTVPADLERGSYGLMVDDWPLGQIELRHFQKPAELAPVANLVFGDQISVAGYQFEPGSETITIKVAWQAEQPYLPDYTVFVQLLEADTNERIAGVDTQPLAGTWPTSRWAAGEVVVDQYQLAAPSDLPPGFYKVIVGLYRPQTGQRLLLDDDRDYWLLPWSFVRK